MYMYRNKRSTLIQVGREGLFPRALHPDAPEMLAVCQRFLTLGRSAPPFRLSASYSPFLSSPLMHLSLGCPPLVYTG